MGDLPSWVRSVPSRERVSVDEPLRRLDEISDDYVAEAVTRCGGNKSRAARTLGIDLKTLSNRLRRRQRRVRDAER